MKDARQKAEEEAIVIVKKWMRDWYETMIYEKDPSMEALALRVGDALESKIKEIETLREAAGKLRDALKSIEKEACWDCSGEEQAREALKEFDKVMGGVK